MRGFPMILSAAQCRAARALLEWSPEQLSDVCGVDPNTIADFETRFRRPTDDAQRRMRAALEQAGVEIIPENGGGAGARLRFNRLELRALARWEAEGGTVGQDAIF